MAAEREAHFTDRRPGKDEKKILQRVDALRDEAIALCCSLVRLPSVNPNYPNIDIGRFRGGESRCNELLAQRYEDIGCEVDFFEAAPGRHNLIGTLKGSGGGKSLIFNGHIDTVPFTEPDKWMGGDPFSGAVEYGRIYGRGACDMKAGIVAQFMAAKALIDCGIKLKGDLILQSVLGEEWMEHEIGTTALIGRGYRADAAVIGEPSAPPVSLAVIPVTSGMIWMSLTCRGKPAHFSMRDELVRAGGRGSEVGVHAVDKAIFLLNALRKLDEDWGQTKKHPLFRPGHFTLYAGAIFGGPVGIPVPFQFAGYCTIEYVIWHSPNEDPDDVKHEVTDFIMQVAKLDPWLTENPPEIKWNFNWPAANLDPTHPIVQCMLAAHAVATDTGGELRSHSQMQGFCAVDDATWFINAGIPAVTYGPGSLYQAHSENEFVSVDELIAAAKVFAIAAMHWCEY
jgi:acetylornithine deacetylase/succinyl-diaminopimelate desuccinylase family protein